MSIALAEKPKSKAQTLKDQIDEYAILKKEAAKMKKRLEALANTLKEGRQDGDILKGNVWNLVYSESDPYDKLDTDMIRAEMPEKWIKDHSKPVIRTELKPVPKAIKI